MRIIAYTYEADVHCPGCAREAFPADTKLMHPIIKALYDTGPPDEHGVGGHAVDREGNAIWPVFDTDENTGYFHCSKCFSDL